MSESSRIIPCLDIIKNKRQHSLRLKTARTDVMIARNQKRQTFLDRWYYERSKTVNYQKIRKQTKNQFVNQKMLDRIIKAKITVPEHRVPHSVSAYQLSMSNVTDRELSPCNNHTHNSFLNWKNSQIKLWRGNEILRNNILSIKYSPGQYSQTNLNKNSFYHLKKSKQRQGLRLTSAVKKKDVGQIVEVKVSTDWTMNMDTDLKPLIKPKTRIVCQREKMMKKANNLYLKRLREQQNMTKRVIDHRNQTFLT